jgi:hypothetical protein
MDVEADLRAAPATAPLAFDEVFRAHFPGVAGEGPLL